MNTISSPEAEGITLADMLTSLLEYFYFLFKKKYSILIFITVFGLIGIFYVSFFYNVKYNAKATFIVEDSKGLSGLGGLASLAGQFGVDFGSAAANNNSLISGDNLLLYFSSESLARNVLLQSFDSNSNRSIADEYINKHGFYSKWEKDSDIGKVKFPIDNGTFVYTRLQDSLLQVLIRDNINKYQFTVSKVDKKAGFFQVNVKMNNEYLAKLYCERLIDFAVKRYVSLKTEKQVKLVNKLQERADSILNLLNSKTQASANLQTSTLTMDVNLLYRTRNNIKSETTTRDKTILVTVYGEVIKNLELAKFTLSQETPVIQLVDMPYFPLKVDTLPKYLVFFIFVFSGFLIGVIYISIIFLFINNRSS